MCNCEALCPRQNSAGKGCQVPETDVGGCMGVSFTCPGDSGCLCWVVAAAATAAVWHPCTWLPLLQWCRLPRGLLFWCPSLTWCRGLVLHSPISGNLSMTEKQSLWKLSGSLQPNKQFSYGQAVCVSFPSPTLQKCLLLRFKKKIYKSLCAAAPFVTDPNPDFYMCYASWIVFPFLCTLLRFDSETSFLSRITLASCELPVLGFRCREMHFSVECPVPQNSWV